MNLYKVGTTSRGIAKIRAPSPEAVVACYSQHVYNMHGSPQFDAAIYEMDGEAYEGDNLPMFDIHLGARTLSDEEFEILNAEMDQCEIVEWNG